MLSDSLTGRFRLHGAFMLPKRDIEFHAAPVALSPSVISRQLPGLFQHTIVNRVQMRKANGSMRTSV
jgi:hypothetical protein